MVLVSWLAKQAKRATFAVQFSQFTFNKPSDGSAMKSFGDYELADAKLHLF